jgi:hypothetical protein
VAIIEPTSSRNRGPGCTTGKLMYPSESAASRVAKQFGQRIYVCPFCFQYHLTSQADMTLNPRRPGKRGRKW